MNVDCFKVYSTGPDLGLFGYTPNLICDFRYDALIQEVTQLGLRSEPSVCDWLTKIEKFDGWEPMIVGCSFQSLIKMILL